MFMTLLRSGLFAVAIMLCAASGANAVPMAAPATLLTSQSQVTPITFWAQPYPYRYIPVRRCPLVRVETPYGWYMDRVCSPVGPVLRRAY